MSFDLKIAGGDFVIKNGDLQKVVDTEKLIQDILKICLTTAGSNPVHPWYGSHISKTLVGSVLDNPMLVQIAKSQLNSALENLKNLQNLQLKSFQRMSAEEQIASIMDISVQRNQLDPRLFDIRISVVSKSLKPVSTDFTVTL